MRVGLGALGALLANNVLELKFVRRKLKPGWSNTRRILCTNDLKLLNSLPGHLALNYRMPSGVPPYPTAPKNLICTWDIMFQDFRMINCSDVNVISVIPTTPADDFWKYFAESLYPMSAQEKIGFCQG